MLHVQRHSETFLWSRNSVIKSNEAALCTPEPSAWPFSSGLLSRCAALEDPNWHTLAVRWTDSNPVFLPLPPKRGSDPPWCCRNRPTSSQSFTPHAACSRGVILCCYFWPLILLILTSSPSPSPPHSLVCLCLPVSPLLFLSLRSLELRGSRKWNLVSAGPFALSRNCESWKF